MSESLHRHMDIIPHGSEAHKGHEAVHKAPEAKHEHEHENQSEAAHEARNDAHIEALTIAETISLNTEKETPRHDHGHAKSEKQRAYVQTLQEAQGHLSAPLRTVSKIIHAPAVDVAATAIEKTIAGPTLLIGSALIGLIGLGAIFVYASNIGFSLSGSELLVLMALGWIAGLLIAPFTKLLR